MSGDVRATVPAITYLSVDSLSGGVGASQVLPYIERLARRGASVTLHSFENGAPSPEALVRLRAAGVDWHTHRFGRDGHVGGLGRMLRGAWFVRRAPLVHGRGDLPALAASLRRSRPFVWDMRGFWVDERIMVGSVRRGSLVERAASERATAGQAVAAHHRALERGRVRACSPARWTNRRQDHCHLHLHRSRAFSRFADSARPRRRDAGRHAEPSL